MTRGLEPLLDELQQQGNPEQAVFAQRFFKTGPGEYAEGDRFLGIRVPVLRSIARRYRHLALSELETLLHSPIHEHRLVALILLSEQFRRGDKGMRRQIYHLYLANTRYINNWDLIDISAAHILGAYLHGRDPAPLFKLAASAHWWDRRIAVIATLHAIRGGEFATILALAECLLHDPHALIHKAVGWMLREVGKRDPASAEAFLQHHCGHMPRTMLRYAIEKLPENRRNAFLKGLICDELPGKG